MTRVVIAAHTPPHIADWMQHLIAPLATNTTIHADTTWILCTSLPETLNADTHYLLLGGVPPINPPITVMHLGAPKSLHDWQTNIAALLQASPSICALAHGWSLHTTMRMLVHADHDSIRLTEMECELLAYLAQHHGTDIRREQLMQHVWHYDSSTQSHTLETHLYRLRGKLDATNPPPCQILTTDAGYRLSL